MAFLSDCTVCWTRPLEAFCEAALLTVTEPRKIFWKASWVPDAAVRTTRLIEPVAVAPGTSSQLRICPEKIPLIVSCDRLETGLAGFVTTQMASFAILLKKMPPGSLSLGSRDESPIVTRPAATSATPTSDPPCARRNFTRPGYCLRYDFASRAKSGATEVEPLAVMTGVADALAGMAEPATAATLAVATSSRRRRDMRGTPFELREAGGVFRPGP